MSTFSFKCLIEVGQGNVFEISTDRRRAVTPFLMLLKYTDTMDKKKLRQD